MEFNEEEIKEIDEELRKAKERQLRNGNRTYTTKEVWEIVHKAIEEAAAYLQN